MVMDPKSRRQPRGGLSTWHRFWQLVSETVIRSTLPSILAMASLRSRMSCLNMYSSRLEDVVGSVEVLGRGCELAADLGIFHPTCDSRFARQVSDSEEAR